MDEITYRLLTIIAGTLIGRLLWDILFEQIKTLLEKKNSRPKCPNDHNCADCIYSKAIFDGVKFKGFRCEIYAR